MSITVYGRSYWDVEIAVPLGTLGEGKGKVDVPVTTSIGGFAVNAARAIDAVPMPLEVQVVTNAVRDDLRRLETALPASAVLRPIITAREGAMPDISVILNPASDCRILRDPGDANDPHWQVDSLDDAVWNSHLHVLGRVPPHVATAVSKRATLAGKRVAWCGGDAMPREVEKQCDVVCVNSAEADRLLGTATSSTRERASALAARATKRGALRLVTGRGSQPTIAALKTEHGIDVFESVPRPLEKSEIVGFLGVGDAFAATFLAHALYNSEGVAHQNLHVQAGLDAAQEAAAHFITHPRPRGAS